MIPTTLPKNHKLRLPISASICSLNIVSSVSLSLKILSGSIVNYPSKVNPIVPNTEIEAPTLNPASTYLFPIYMPLK
jgi:hypothetical protein